MIVVHFKTALVWSLIGGDPITLRLGGDPTVAAWIFDPRLHGCCNPRACMDEGGAVVGDASDQEDTPEDTPKAKIYIDL